MEIRKVELYFLEMRLKEPFKTSFGVTDTRTVVLTRVEEKGGEEGWGEIVAGHGPWYSYETYEIDFLVLEKYIVPLVIGENLEDVTDYVRLVSKIRGYPMAKAGIEEALWDLYSRETGVPLSKLFGGMKKEIVSGVSIGIKPNVEMLIKEVYRRLDEGYRRIKIKIEPGKDVILVKRIREEFGDIPLQVDANGAYTLADMDVFLKLDKFGLLMIEQPLNYDDLLHHSILSRKMRTPICLDESIRSLHDTILAHKLGSAEIVNIKPARVGGLLQSKKILDAVSGLGLGAWIGGMLETGIGRAFLVALASHPSVTYPNDISASDRYWDEDIVEPPWSLTKNGTIVVPREPGLGVEVKTPLIEKLVKKKWSIVA